MKKKVLIIILSICMYSFSFAQTADREQLDRLTAHLTLIQEEARLDRTVGGGVLIGTGILIGVGGVILTESIPELTSDDRIMYDAIFLGTGTLAVVSGVLILTLPSEYEILPAKFKALPEDSPENMRKKINLGEVYLEKLAHQAENDRYLSGGILIATGLAELAFYFFVPPDDIDNYSSMHDMFLYEGILNCGMGLLKLFIKSAPENEYQTYREWKKWQGITQTVDDTDIQFALMPTPRGIAAVIKISY